MYPQWELLTEKMTSRLGLGLEREEREREEEGVAFGLLTEAAPGEDACADLNLSHVGPLWLRVCICSVIHTYIYICIHVCMHYVIHTYIPSEDADLHLSHVGPLWLRLF